MRVDPPIVREAPRDRARSHVVVEEDCHFQTEV
jgi:hypothetical protein